MTDDTVLKLNDLEQNDLLQAALREDVRKLLAAAIKSEAAAFVKILEKLCDFGKISGKFSGLEVQTYAATDNKLTAECPVLPLKPRECMFKMMRLEIRPQFVSHVKICVHGLHWQKPAQPASTSPSYYQIQT